MLVSTALCFSVEEEDHTHCTSHSQPCLAATWFEILAYHNRTAKSFGLRKKPFGLVSLMGRIFFFKKNAHLSKNGILFVLMHSVKDVHESICMCVSFSHFSLHLFYVCTWACVCYGMRVGVRGQPVESLLSCHVDSRNQTHSIRLGCKRLQSPSHLASPTAFLF